MKLNHQKLKTVEELTKTVVSYHYTIGTTEDMSPNQTSIKVAMAVVA